MFLTIFLITLSSLLITFGMTPFVIQLAEKYKLVDDPKKRPHPAHTHTKVIPRAGGIALFMGITLPMILFVSLSKSMIGILIGAFILILAGLWDDRRDRSPYLRFFINCIAAAIAIGFGVGISYLTNPFDGVIPLDTFKINFEFLGSHSIWVWADIFALFWIVWTTNIVGWSGGVDGQLPGFVAISAFVIGILSLRYAHADPSQLSVTLLSFATAGSFLGFLPWNFYPQKIMPGYGGKTLAGFMLAILSILSFSKLGTALLVLAVPMTDAIFLFVKRISQGKSPVWATSEHLHHHLLKIGWGRRRIASFYWLISASAGVIALTLNSQQKVFATILILVTITMFIVWINFFKELPKKIEEK